MCGRSRFQGLLEGGRIQVAPGSRFTRGTRFMGIDLAEYLDRQARYFMD